MFYLNAYLLCAAQKKGKHEHSTAKLHHFGLLRDVSQIKVKVFLIITHLLVNAYISHVIWMHKNTCINSRYVTRGYYIFTVILLNGAKQSKKKKRNKTFTWMTSSSNLRLKYEFTLKKIKRK